jgi:hypothetical protein
MDLYQKFNLKPYPAYDWIVAKKLIGKINSSSISPWYQVDEMEMKYINEIFKSHQHNNLILFARRQDCDDMAFFKITENTISDIYVIEGWIGDGYNVIEIYHSLWDWLKSVIDDLSELAG